MPINFYQGQNNLLEESSNKPEDESIKIIKEKLEGFYNMKNLYFFFGSGTSCPAIPNMSGLYKGLKTSLKNDTALEQLFADIANGTDKNLEKILGVLYSGKAYYNINKREYKDKYEKIVNLIKYIEEYIFSKINIDFKSAKSQNVFDNYKLFYQKMSFRNKDLSRISVFTTNNDLFNEKALDYLNIHYIDGFLGGITKYFNPAMFNYTYSKRMDTGIDKFEPVENFVYLYKLHGSINWKEENCPANSYFNIRQISQPLKYSDNAALVYPTPLKQNMSIGSPYVDIMREFQHKLLMPNSVLFVIGYSFSDEHINDIIYRSLATNTSINIIILNNVKGPISIIDDYRIFRIWEDPSDKPLHYFDRIIREILPNLNRANSDNLLDNFVDALHKFNTINNNSHLNKEPK